MPELPEVETTRRGIAPFLEGSKIAEIRIRNTSLRWPVPESDLYGLIGEQVRRVTRRGKYILLETEKGTILVHLGMSGSLRVVTNQQEPAGKHDHVDLVTCEGVVIRFNDPRRFGCWLFQATNKGMHPLLETLGPEPLEEDFTAQYLYDTSRGKTQAIKTFIMDSHVVVGVGNIYASEALFIAGIHPKRAAGKVSLRRYQSLAGAIRKVLTAAIAQGGTTLRDYVNSEGKPGYFRQQLFVYGKAGQQCQRCAHSIKSMRLGQRSTFYCPVCQK